MAFTNNIMIVRHRLLTELVKLWRDNELVEKIDRLPIELSPRRSKHAGRCCVHKERAVWKYKSLPLLGLDMEDEKDELTPLSEYAVHALDRAENGTPKDNIMCVIDEACSACVQINYEITNLCRGCTARSCQTNCPKKAVHVKESGQAWIDHDECISCGICHKSCPYHAIVYIPVPCEEACPVKAISKDKKGIEHIDESKCIYCGKCLNACPFGAIFEVSQVFDILHKIRKGEKIAIIGDNGSGKSTLISLLLRFLKPGKGSIYLDGKEIEEYDLGEYRDLFGVVSQDIYLFKDTVKANIAMGRKIDDEEMDRTCKMMNMQEFIGKLPQGYETRLEKNGENLSGGERQKIALLRAIIKKSPILVLDEATANIDKKYNELLHYNILKDFPDKTLIVITHKTENLAGMDRIYEIQNHAIKECDYAELEKSAFVHQKKKG